jgi:broad specificity phosphatase PhoE
MKIGLVRHFKVHHPFPSRFLLSAKDIVQWFDEYELAAVERGQTDLQDIRWDICFSSPLPRALHTANAIVAGDVIPADELKELDVLPLLNQGIRLPFLVWAMVIKARSSSVHPVTDQFRSRISAFADRIVSGEHEHVLVVSHGFVMMFLQQELEKRGFSGQRFRSPRNGKLYVFAK